MQFSMGAATRTRDGITSTSILDCFLTNYSIHVFQGTLSNNDIIVKYRNTSTSNRTRLRTPKHIHWVVDLLLKMQGDNELTKQLIEEMKLYWEQAEPMTDNNYETIKKIVVASNNIEKYHSLNSYGEYDVEFLITIMKLLAIQEKTNNDNAFMFYKVLEELTHESLDLFKIISTATHNGKH